MGLRIATAAVALEPSHADGVEDGYSQASHRGWCRGRRRRRLPSLLPRMGSTIAAMVVAPDISAELVDDGSCDSGSRRQWWREWKGKEKKGDGR
uniref:DUF834 domain-containing protein n=1 Tax=Oryza punctata TaxID=4537 RepID=A0A0E0JM85_ORYPU